MDEVNIGLFVLLHDAIGKRYAVTKWWTQANERILVSGCAYSIGDPAEIPLRLGRLLPSALYGLRS